MDLHIQNRIFFNNNTVFPHTDSNIYCQNFFKCFGFNWVKIIKHNILLFFKLFFWLTWTEGKENWALRGTTMLHFLRLPASISVDSKIHVLKPWPPDQYNIEKMLKIQCYSFLINNKSILSVDSKLFEQWPLSQYWGPKKGFKLTLKTCRDINDFKTFFLETTMMQFERLLCKHPQIIYIVNSTNVDTPPPPLN